MAVYSTCLLCLLPWIIVTDCLDNIAHNKTSYQPSTYRDDTANKAVDGDKLTCAQPYNADRETAARWWVDLGENYYVSNITIWNSNQEIQATRLTNFLLSVGPTLDSLALCGPVYTGQPTQGALLRYPVGELDDMSTLKGLEDQIYLS